MGWVMAEKMAGTRKWTVLAMVELMLGRTN
jgi:hypothetical protein